MTTSDRKRAANRANATRSTGPRSASGKARASRNALRHGLNLPVTQSVSEGEVEALARRFAGGDPEKLEFARAAAEAHLDLARIRGAKDLILMKACGDFGGPMGSAPGAYTIQEMVWICLADVADRLITLDGYERKALSRRKRALRAVCS